MKIAKKFLLSAGLALIPLSRAYAGGWVAPPNQPTGSPKDFELVVKNATNWILGFVALIAIIAIIWGGVQYLVSVGSEETIRTAKSTIKTAIMGLVIAGIAYAIVNVIITKILVEGSGGTAATTNSAAAPGAM